MFTGLIEATGSIEAFDQSASGGELRVASSMAAELRTGDSIAVNGVCLTATAIDAGGFSAVVSPETLRITSLGDFARGRVVNLERPLRADSRLGGHFVLGHVDAVGRITELRPDAECWWLEVEFPPALAPLLVSKGSVAVDGVSLTVAALAPRRFGVQIVPHTWAHTALSAAHVGDAVNLEGDVIGKYVARLMDAHRGEPSHVESVAAFGGGRS
jgi:riboflavin synthase